MWTPLPFCLNHIYILAQLYGVGCEIDFTIKEFYGPFIFIYEVDFIKTAWMQSRHQDVCSHVFMAPCFYDWYAIVWAGFLLVVCSTFYQRHIWVLYPNLSNLCCVLFSQGGLLFRDSKQTDTQTITIWRCFICWCYFKSLLSLASLHDIILAFLFLHVHNHHFDLLTSCHLAFKLIHHAKQCWLYHSELHCVAQMEVIVAPNKMSFIVIWRLNTNSNPNWTDAGAFSHGCMHFLYVVQILHKVSLQAQAVSLIRIK